MWKLVLLGSLTRLPNPVTSQTLFYLIRFWLINFPEDNKWSIRDYVTQSRLLGEKTLTWLCDSWKIYMKWQCNLGCFWTNYYSNSHSSSRRKLHLRSTWFNLLSAPWVGLANAFTNMKHQHNSFYHISLPVSPLYEIREYNKWTDFIFTI